MDSWQALNMCGQLEGQPGTFRFQLKIIVVTRSIAILAHLAAPLNCS